MSWNKHGGTGWTEIRGTGAVIRKTSNGWFQVRGHEDEAPAFSSRDSDFAYRIAHERWPLPRFRGGRCERCVGSGRLPTSFTGDGAERTICPQCHGSGRAPASEPPKCERCDGTGKVVFRMGLIHDPMDGRNVRCPTCHGSGRASEGEKG